MKTEYKTISAYNGAQDARDKAICDLLREEIDRAMPKAESRIWHGSPVWFLDGNPIVGYHKLKNCVRLLFWSGQSFDEDGLEPEGTFKAAEARFTDPGEVKATALRRWLAKSKKIQWDYKNIVKRKGVLEKLEAKTGSARTCPKGHNYFKSSDCPTCPKCEALKNAASEFLSGLGAPARRALESQGITTLKKLSGYTEKEILDLHGMGPASMPALKKALKTAGLSFAKARTKRP